MKSKSHSCEYHKCGQEAKQFHGTYIRNVQDLPILGKSVRLEIKSYEYECNNPECDAVSTVEDFGGFLSYYGRMTDRLADFLCTFALETSCEGAARICKEIGIKTSGDSIIRTLIKKYEKQPLTECGDVIGVDDFAFKKRFTYGIIIRSSRYVIPSTSDCIHPPSEYRVSPRDTLSESDYICHSSF